MFGAGRGDALTDASSRYRRLADQGIPLLLIYGTQDQRLPRESMNRLRELLPDIDYQEISGTGHPVHYEAPDRVNPPLIEFLRD
jgi:pimeloyl-ACP methyl ester carboxylesterase